MTNERTEQLLASGVLQAWAQKKPIQRMKISYFNDTWTDLPPVENPDFADSDYIWRVKPEPRRWWANLYFNDAIPFKGFLYDSRDAADRNAGEHRTECVQVQVHEIP